MSDYIDNIKNEIGEINSIAEELEELANAFDLTGNSNIAIRLVGFCDSLTMASESIYDDVNVLLKEAREGSYDLAADMARGTLEALAKAVGKK